jgi:hypothetical protein
VKRFILLSIALVGCKWTDFDDLSNQTWVRSQDKPSIGSTDYAISITQATSDTNGGELAVVSTDAPTLSTIIYDPSGTEKVGGNPAKLGQHFIASLGEKPILVNDGMGHVALVEKAIDANVIAVVSGQADAPADLTFMGAPPTAATYGGPNGTNLYIAAPTPATGTPNLFVVDGTTNMPQCSLLDEVGMPLQAAAIATDSTKLWVWTKTGSVISYALNTLVAGSCTNLNKGTAAFTQSFMPGTGASIHIVTSGTKEWAVLAAHADKATNGEVVVLDLATADSVMPPMQVGTTLMVDGLLSSTVGTFDTMTYVVLGIPSQQVGSTQAGQVEIHAFDPMTGTLDATAMETLHDAQPENGQLFGRDVTTMQFNGKTILVVAASNEVFAYYRTSIYPTDTRNPPPSP